MANDSSQNQCAQSVQNPQNTLKIPPHLLPSEISVFGYGVTSKPFVEFINSCGKVCHIYDDRFEIKSSDKNGNILLPPSAFCPSKSSLEFISPGILPTHRFFSTAQNPIGEYDFVWELMNANDIVLKSIWISGTNGKTTTTQMLTHLLESFGALSGGNIGTPLTTLAIKHSQISLENTLDKNKSHKNLHAKNPNAKNLYPKNPLWVLESSSFAMHYAHIATPQIYLLLPLSQDHISWHNGFEGYVEDKLRVLSRMDKDSFALLPKELKTHKIVQEYVARNGKDCAIFYTDSSSLAEFCKVDLKSLPFAEPFLLDSLVALSGALLAQKIGLLDSCLDSSVKSSSDFLAHLLDKLDSFHIGAHRIEEFYEICQNAQKNTDKKNQKSTPPPKWLWVDDSKGTNTDATLQAFKRYKGRRIYAILGGDDKGADIEPIFSLLANGFYATNDESSFVKLFAIGSNEAKILDLAKKYKIFAIACENLKNAIDSIKSKRDKDLQDFVKSNLKSNNTKSSHSKSTQDLDFISSFVGLLSPAAASLDQFSSYKQRGELFKKYALESTTI